jgi:NAD(P)-dependent dehydrogenase (short-subunit alcohol dehydrogenase family)
MSAGEKMVEELRAAGITTGTTQVFELDVGSLASVRKFAQQVLEACPRIHLLYNNGESIHCMQMIFDRI